jgi:6-phosphogluconolactonase
MMSGRGAIVYVGTYTEQVSHLKGTPGEGISVYRFDPSSGALQFVQVVAGPVNPSFVALDPGGRYLYAVNETGELDGERSGAVSALTATGRVDRVPAPVCVKFLE